MHRAIRNCLCSHTSILHDTGHFGASAILDGMGRTHKEQSELAQEIAEASAKITIGAKYWHHKSRKKVYEVLGLGFMEASDELCVMYQARYGEKLTFIRPLSVWLETVAWEGKQMSRFIKI